MNRPNIIERIAQIDPERITVDTVKMLFPLTPKWMARGILNTSVRRGEFTKNEDGTFRLIEGEKQT